MVEFLYDFFYEVLSEEGIWVLILIGSGFAVASFILLMMKIETNPKQRKAAAKGTVTETMESPVPAKKKKIKFKKNKSKNEENVEADGPPQAMPVRPEMVMPDNIEPGNIEPGNIAPDNTEQVEMEITDPDGFSIPALPETGDEPSPLNDTPMPSVPQESAQELQPGLSPEDVDAIVVEDGPATDSVETVKNEAEDEEQKNEKSDDSDIFDIFTEVEEEESNVAEFAKNLDDVAIGGLLSETEELSEELKSMFTKHRRA
ncbi:MAG: hypothetical protein P8105_11210 [Dehalococcoidia bacterium]